MLRRFEFDYEFINKGRLVLEPSVFENINKNNLEARKRMLKSQKDGKEIGCLRKASYILPNIIKCNKDWPLCIYDLNYKNQIVLFFIISIGEKPHFIDNYFFQKTTHNLGMVELGNYNFQMTLEEEEGLNKEEYKLIPFKKLIIERRIHKCMEGLEEEETEINRDKSKSMKNFTTEKIEIEEDEKLDKEYFKSDQSIIKTEIEDIISDVSLKSKLIILTFNYLINNL